MYAIVDIKGFQYKLEKGDTLRVPKFDMEVGKKVKLSDVLLVADGEQYSIGKPYVEGALVEATVTNQGKHDKIIVFKKKRRKDYSVKRGHRQDFTEISIDNIKISEVKKAKKTAEKKSEVPEMAELKPEVPETAVKKEKAPKTAEMASPDTQTVEKELTAADTPEKEGKAIQEVKKKTRAKKTVKKKLADTETSGKKSEKTETAEKKSEKTETAEKKSEDADTSE